MKKILPLLLLMLIAFPQTAPAGKSVRFAGLQYEASPDWTASVRGSTLHLEKKDKSAIVMVSRMPVGNQPISLEKIRSLTQSTGHGMLPNAVETNLVLRDFDRNPFTGYYYSLTDKQDKPGEFKMITQGAVTDGHLMLTFTILYNPSYNPSKEAFSMISSMSLEN